MDEALKREIFDNAKKRFLELEKEWKSLGFWKRFWRSREFNVRFGTIIAILERYKS